MENIIVVLDDATHALNQVLPMRKEGVRTHWILLACPPRLTRHISRWVNQGSRNAWRKRWARTWNEVKFCSDACRRAKASHG